MKQPSRLRYPRGRLYRETPSFTQSDKRAFDRDLCRGDNARRDRYATLLHLQDVLREHGYDHSWQTYDIGNETLTFRPLPLSYPGSMLGSSASMCCE